MAEEVENKQVIFKGYIDGVPKLTDMELKFSNIQLNTPSQSQQALLVKNLYLSCDPYMRGRMRDFHGSYIPPFVPSKVSIYLSITTIVLYLPVILLIVSLDRDIWINLCG
jgi:NADPH-dependent curcumin reductase CurA